MDVPVFGRVVEFLLVQGLPVASVMETVDIGTLSVAVNPQFLVQTERGNYFPFAILLIFLVMNSV